MGSKNIKEINDRMNTIFSGIMSIFTLTLFLITGEKKIMFITGIMLCVLCIFNFLIDMFFRIKNKDKTNGNYEV